MLSVLEFFQKRKTAANFMFNTPGAKRTILVSSHIWWVDLIALALIRLGYNVLVAEPFYLLYTVDDGWKNFDSLYNQWLGYIKQLKIDLIIGGNTTGMVSHPKTGQMLHEAAGIPLVNYWWDEPRAGPPFAKRGFTCEAYLDMIRNPRTLNIFWDIDVLEEMQLYFAVTNSAHIPLGATPDFWRVSQTPLAQRPTKICFLGNCHFTVNEPDMADPVAAWAVKIVQAKRANFDRPMVDCIAAAGALPSATGGDTWSNTFARWEVLNAIWMNECRNKFVQAAGAKLGGDFVLVGKGWEKLGLHASAEHSGVPAAGNYYGAAQGSLNLFGGCVHGGMPLRPFEIAASNGLIVTHYSRELPALYEAGKECLSFKTQDDMLDAFDRVARAPQDFEPMLAAGRQRTLAHHTWEQRVTTLMQVVGERFGV